MTISAATWALLDRYGSDPAAVSWQWESMVAQVLVRYGSRADVDALLPVFLADPGERRRLVPVFARHGDAEVGERLLAGCTAAGRLRDGAPSAVLHAAGYLGCESATRVLWEHVDRPDYDYDASQDACLGLLHLSCRELRTDIAQSLERHFGANFFPEFLPVLAAKTGDPSWLARLIEWGEGGASTDCNGGLILGVALHDGAAGIVDAAHDGGAARAEFVRLLWDRRWEACGGGTGSDRWAYAGTRVLGIGIPELYADLVTRSDSAAAPGNAAYWVATFTALLAHRARRGWLGLRMAADLEENESGAALCDLMFEWSTPHKDDSLKGLADRFLDHRHSVIGTLHRLEDTLRAEARHELELRVLTTASPRHRGVRDGGRGEQDEEGEPCHTR